MQVTADYQNGKLTLRLFGELDHYAASYTLRSLESAIEEYLPQQCELELSGLTFMDSSGVAVLLKTERLMRQTGCVYVSGANEQIQRVLKLSGLGGMIHRDPTSIKECETIYEC